MDIEWTLLEKNMRDLSTSETWWLAPTPRQKIAWLIILPTLLLPGLFGWGQGVFRGTLEGYVWMHPLFNVAHIVLAGQLFALCRRAYRDHSPGASVWLTWLLFGVIWLDLSHMFADQVLARGRWAAGDDLALLFWTSSRFLMTLALLLLGLESLSPSPNWFVLRNRGLVGVAMVLALFIGWFEFGGTNLELVRSCSVGLILLQGCAAMLLLNRYVQTQWHRTPYFLLASLTLLVGSGLELMGAFQWDWCFWLGHVYCLAAYFCLYQGVYLEFLHAPYQELVRSQQELAVLRTKLEALFECAADGVLVVSPQGHIERVNQRLCEMFGYTEAELLGHTVEMLVPEAFRQQHQQLRQLIFNTISGPRLMGQRALQGRRRDASAFPVEVALSPVIVNGQRLGTMALVRDVSVRDAVQEKLRINETRFRGYVENTPDLIWEIDGQEHLSYISPQSMGLLGYGPEELHGQPFHLLLGSVGFWTERIRQQKPIHNMLHGFFHRNGQVVMVETNAKPQYDATGKRVGCLCISRDVRPRMRHEAALQASERRFQRAFDHAPIGMALVDLQWHWKKINRSLLELVDYQESELLGRSLFDLLDPGDHASVNALAQAARTRAPIHPPLELLMMTRSGAPLWLELTANWMESADAAGHYVVQTVDVTRRVEDDQRIRLLSSIVEQSSDLIGVLHQDLRLTYLNAAGRRALGILADEPVEPLNLQQFQSAEMLQPQLAPELLAQGHWEGEVVWQARNGTTRQTLQTIQLHRNVDGEAAYLSIVARDISTRIEYEAMLRRQAECDALTGLPNRTVLGRLLATGIAEAAARGVLLAVVYLEMGNIKRVNEMMGHASGDELVLLAARRLNLALGEDDLLVRTSGESFVMALKAPDLHYLLQEISRLLEVFESPFGLGGREILVHAHAGICVYPYNLDRPDELLRKADVAMYRAKSKGRNQFQFYAEDMDREIRAAIDLEAELRMALEHQQLELFLQAKVDGRSGRIVGAEALMRWRHPVRGLLAPGLFIPAAERTGVIKRIDEWAIAEACRLLHGLDDEWGELSIAVNISAHQFLYGDLADHLELQIRRYGVAPSRLELEITETAMIQDPDSALALLKNLQAMGLRIALDDFGTGYSSLSYLKRFPVDVLKIDRSFVMDLCQDSADSHIVRAVVDLAEGLDIAVVAEGVETAAQAQYLLESGCVFMQGYLFAKPLPVRDFLLLLNDRNGQSKVPAHAE